METLYTSEKNAQLLIFLLKAHKVKKIVASPGATNVCLVASLQHDPYFEIYSSVDERSAAYIACGLAAESGEPVALTCTGATASRNYIPGLTEAFYRKLPILAITATQHTGKIGNLFPQVIDRTNPLNDITVFHAGIPTIYSVEDEWAYGLAINKALIALRDNGGGPVHLDLATDYSTDYSVSELPNVQVVHKICLGEEMPIINSTGRIAIFVGSHSVWSDMLQSCVDSFCEKYNAVVFIDHTSNYKGKYGVQFNLVTGQNQYRSLNKTMDILIHIGEVSGAYMDLQPKEVWRVNVDGEIRDYYKKLKYVFGMDEISFFKYYTESKSMPVSTDYFDNCIAEYNEFIKLIPEVPFSNIWMAQHLHDKLPQNSVLHLGILNSLRAWNFFEIDKTIYGYSNTGGFGIDGIISTAMGGAIAAPLKLHFCVLGDLAFFYDLNVIGNRHVTKNLRILLVNNGVGTEFKNYSHPAYKLGMDADDYIAARGHFGAKSKKLVKNYAIDLGFEYIFAESKEEFIRNMDRFISPEIGEKPIVFEVFTNSDEESEALFVINHLKFSTSNKAKSVVKSVIGEKNIENFKKIVRRL